MLDDPTAVSHLLLPVPREIRPGPGVCRIGSTARCDCRVDDPRIRRAVERYLAGFRRASGGHVRITIAVESGTLAHRDGYRLRVTPDAIELFGGSPAGCFLGLQTLAQLSNPHTATVPCGTVVDWPDFETRGLLHDVTRGKVPTLDTLKGLVDRLALLKVNQLQLYIEHAFVFTFDPDICAPGAGLTPGEIRELDDYCKERFIELVPAIATFGHMGRILSMPKYRHLAEVEATVSWDAMTWPQRARGLTLDCINPESHRLVERMWSDALDAFTSPVVNLCGDEPWDLGAGRNRERFLTSGMGVPYIEHIRRTYDVCAARGRRVQAWSDVVRNHPDLLHLLPRDLTVLHWGYDDGADYEGTRIFTEAGFDTVVCPGTSGWKRIVSAMGLAERNIAAFAEAGRKFGAKGLLNTDWGDHGHFQPLACSMHGIAMGASLAWRADHPVGARVDSTGGSFDNHFARVVWGVNDPAGVALLRSVSSVADSCETWRLLWSPLDAIRDEATLPTVDAASTMKEDAAKFLAWLGRTDRADFRDPADHDELTIAARFVSLFAGKVAFARRAAAWFPASTAAKRVRREWAEAVTNAAEAYAGVWSARNKPSGLDDILTGLEAVRREILEG